MTWDACAKRYDNAEEMLDAYRERARRAVAATTRPVVIRKPEPTPMPEPVGCEVIHSVSSLADLTTVGCGQGDVNARALRGLPVIWNGFRLRRAARLAAHLHKVDPSDFIGRLRTPKHAKGALRMLVMLMRRRGFSLPKIGAAFNRDHSSIFALIGERTTPVVISKREPVMRLWAEGWLAKDIATELGMTSPEAVRGTVRRCRAAGDPRATIRPGTNAGEAS